MFKKCSVLDTVFKPQILDFYPPQPRAGFRMPAIAPFCFPSGIKLHSETPSMPKSFSFILTDIDGNRTFTTVLYFDEEAPQFLRQMLPKIRP